VFSFDAAAVTFVAAADTALGVVGAVAVPARELVARVADARVAVAGVDRDAVPRAVAGLDAALAVAGLVEARLAVEPPGLAAAFFGAVAAFALAAPDFAVSVGTDLPPRS
jgi:hypothetical protein